MDNQNRKTTIPIKGIPEIVEWLIANCTPEEVAFMGKLAINRKDFRTLTSIFTRLTDYNIYQVFYEKGIQDGNQLMIYRAAKRGEVAGLKAFAMACQEASKRIEDDRKIKPKK